MCSFLYFEIALVCIEMSAFTFNFHFLIYPFGLKIQSKNRRNKDKINTPNAYMYT